MEENKGNKKKNRLKAIIDEKIMPAIKVKGFLPIDTVRVNISENDRYQQELGQGFHELNGERFPILKMTETQLREHQLFYEQDRKLLVNSKDEVVTTKGLRSKNLNNVQAFVMAKDGAVYMGTHEGVYSLSGNSLVHGSFLSDKPAEMAGLFRIIDGKINWISNNSGHYSPSELDISCDNSFRKDNAWCS